ncbi:DUF6624 domain-containing protein [Paraglaciecola sp.]|uniref:DUF6624 domain-containing protein n=1 Tax=Paraglaciecola sp. TaxID=1920173 RepID=UPI0032643BD3
MLKIYLSSSLIKYLCCFLCLLSISHLSYAQLNGDLQKRLIQMAQQSTQLKLQKRATNKDSNAKVLQQLQTDIVKVHTLTLQEIVSLHGWPSKSLVGKSGVNAATVIVQHAEDVAFQQDMLPLIIKSYLDNQGVSGTNVAITTDIIAINQGNKQVFGTQFEIINNKVSFKPIDNIQTVDDLRAELDLKPLLDFKQQIADQYIYKNK